MKIFIKTLILILICFNAHSKSPCENFYQSLKNADKNSDIFWGIVIPYEELGITTAETDTNGFYQISSITKSELYEKIQVGDSIISINNKDIRGLMPDKEFLTDFVEVGTEADFVFKSKKSNKTYTLKLKNEQVDRFKAPLINTKINYIKVDEINKTFDASISTIHTLSVTKEDAKDFYNAARDNLFFPKDENNGQLNDDYQKCTYDVSKWSSLDTLDPSYGIKYADVVELDRSLQKSYYLIWPQFKEFGGDDSILIEHKTDELIKFGTEFKLQSFPFDRQKIFINKIQSEYSLDEFLTSHETASFENLNEFAKKNSIEGWNIVDYQLSYDAYYDTDIDGYRDASVIEIVIERKSSYYFSKIILPIALILLVCWSSLWITPREIESRLTITIVCLLSLIAYNFVIDSDLPKLEYLTTMDFIILISYFYAALPNFFAIYSHNKLNEPASKKVNFEILGKKYGFLSYLGIVLIIIILNTNFSPENTTQFFNFMKL